MFLRSVWFLRFFIWFDFLFVGGFFVFILWFCGVGVFKVFIVFLRFFVVFKLFCFVVAFLKGF